VSDVAVETRNLRKVYGRKVALADLNLTVRRGQVFGFLGPNGAGKSTAVKALVGLVRPTSGQAFLFGRPADDPAVRRAVGFLPEQFRFQEWMSGEEFLDLHGRLAGLDAPTRRRGIDETLALVGLAEQRRDLLRTFSKGMLQRIGIAQAVIADPDLVILDEPTSALDPIGRRDVRDIIRHLKTAGKTVFLNSHLLSEVEMVCDQAAIVSRGRVLADGALKDLLGRRELDLRVSAPSNGLMHEISARWKVLSAQGGMISLEVKSDDDAADVAEVVARHGARLYSLVPQRASLEELFVRVVSSAERQTGEPAQGEDV
jgi:ABC-2 type transport system ATP-binding protein